MLILPDYLLFLLILQKILHENEIILSERWGGEWGPLDPPDKLTVLLVKPSDQTRTLFHSACESIVIPHLMVSWMFYKRLLPV